MKYSKYPFYISQLIIKSLKGQLTEAEQEELDRWLTIWMTRKICMDSYIRSGLGNAWKNGCI